MQYPEVLIGSDGSEFSEMIDKALSIEKNSALTRRLEEIAQENTWETHAERILQAVEQKLANNGARDIENQ